MEFLKAHFEKIILSAVLLGLIAAAVVLAIQAMTFLGHVKVDTGGPTSVGPKVPAVETTNYQATIQSALAPKLVDYDKPHKIFNPFKVLQSSLDDKLYTSQDFGVQKLLVEKIKPLSLILFPHVRTYGERSSLYMFVTPEYETVPAYAREVARSVSYPVNVKRPQKIAIGRTVSKAKNLTLTITNVVGDISVDAGKIKILAELSMDGYGTNGISLTMSNEWRMVIEYAADLIYPPENKQYPDARVGTPMYFFNDTNRVMEIQADSVTVKEESSGKRTIILIRRPAAPIAPVGIPQNPTTSTNVPAVNSPSKPTP